MTAAQSYQAKNIMTWPVAVQREDIPFQGLATIQAVRVRPAFLGSPPDSRENSKLKPVNAGACVAFNSDQTIETQAWAWLIYSPPGIKPVMVIG